MSSSSGTPIGQLTLVVFESIIQVIFLTLAGYILARMGIMTKSIRKQMNRVNVSIFTPALLFSKVAFFLTPEKIAQLWVIPVIFIIVTIISAGVAWTMGVLFRLRRSQRNFAIASAMFMNSNTLPVALMQTMVATVPELKRSDDDSTDSMLARALTYLVVFSTFGMVLRWSYGVRLLASADEETQPKSGSAPAEILPKSMSTAEEKDVSKEIPQLSYISSGRASGTSTPDTNSLREVPLGHVSDGQDGAFFQNSNRSERTVVPGLSAANSVVALDKIGEPLAPAERANQRWTSRMKPTKAGLKRRWKGFLDFMTAPLWAALLSFVVACIEPVQHFMSDTFPPIKGAIDQAGDCSIPITLVVLGAFFYSPPPKEDLPSHLSPGERPSLGKRITIKLAGIFKHTPPSERKSMPGETRAVFVSVTARMIVAPAILLPLLYLWMIRQWTSVLEDPVFIVSNVLLFGAAPALTLAQMTQASSGDTFERLLSRTIFWSYCVVTPPLTIAFILLGLLMTKQ